ncbi:hypothetical protein [Nonlabens ponticola]|uniref:Uncharacterized protein n=1 Tax=Nonlabens ponticola TaxID=2496866 RepID=A0A3S9MVK9_9FLAO|nr:hypothetical protein [Nonlabens ponticola]AZQ43174.1 hypothetical protein EJ995_02595 [Nonlabens ponticola]
MKHLLFLSFAIMLLSISTCNGQKITGIKYSLFEKHPDNYWLKITPNMFDGNIAETTKTSGIYAVMICYTYNGKEKSVYQDVTSKFVAGEDYTFSFSYGSASLDKLKVNNITFFRRDMDRSTYPDKDNCHDNVALSGANSYNVSMLYNR